MYLIKVLDNIIEDLENGRTYVLNESIPDYDTNTAATTVYVRSWNSAPNETVDLAHELDAIKLWDHLTSLCKLNTVDATKAQDAPQQKPREFRVGQDVSVTLYGEIVAINGYEIKVEFDEFAQPIVCVEQQLEPLNTD